MISGRVVWVVGGGEGVGRALALVLAAKGARVLVSGAVERALGEVVGEMAHAGAKARHAVADPSNPAAANAAVDKAIAVFGGLDDVIVCVAGDGRDAAAKVAFDAARPRLREGGKLVLAEDTLDPAGAVPTYFKIF